ncbi:MAG: copper homeostasis membrane protein CopD [Brevundimonas sp.]|jgi:copper resistance protein D|uniref:copper homeostasis membrane protein CopD n=1 Tax=Brevundimonas sp. TaxID=1871086 RepID=UPI00391ABFA4
MIEAAVIGLRWMQYAAAAAALGLLLFQAYGRGASGVARLSSIAAVAGLLLALTALAGVVAQTAMMAGGWGAAFDPAALGYVAQSTGLGAANLTRAGLALAGAALLLAGRTRRWARVAATVALTGAVASFAWSGHGAATEGAGGMVHLASDIVHALAAAVWLGALPGFLVLLGRSQAAGIETAARALADFAMIGTAAVSALVVTGLVNAVFLAGADGLAVLPASSWGVLLMVKLGVFLVMLGFAAHNRFRLTPALRRALTVGDDPGAATAGLRVSVGLEFLAGAILLGLVAAMGVQMPPVAM